MAAESGTAVAGLGSAPVHPDAEGKLRLVPAPVEGARPTLEMRLQAIHRKRRASHILAAIRFAIWIAGLSALTFIAGAGILGVH